MSRDPANPTDPSLASVLAELAADGWDAQFRSEATGELLCLTCGRSAPAADQHADRARRLEGVSDPADMVMVLLATCPFCGARGSVVLGYGPDASPEDQAVASGLSRRARADALAVDADDPSLGRSADHPVGVPASPTTTPRTDGGPR